MPVSSSAQGSKHFKQLLIETRDSILDAYDHQVCTLSRIVRHMKLNRNVGRTPLVDVIFNYSTYFTGLDMHQLKVSSHENRRKAVNFDLFLNIVEDDGSLIVDWDYNADLFYDETLGRWISHLQTILEAIAGSAELPIEDIPLLSKKEQDEILVQWNKN